jgi:hypothetical protein
MVLKLRIETPLLTRVSELVAFGVRLAIATDLHNVLYIKIREQFITQLVKRTLP